MAPPMENPHRITSLESVDEKWLTWTKVEVVINAGVYKVDRSLISFPPLVL